MRAGYDGYKRKKGSKVHRAVDTLGHLLVTPANEQERAQVAELARSVQQVTGRPVEVAFVDQGYTGDEAAEAARQQDIRLDVVKLPEAKRGFVLLPRLWVVERSFGAWLAIMNDWPKPWRACTLSSLPSSCSSRPLHCSKVHNTL